ncbi:MAG: dipeptide ABC transporter ATP-binding protein [Roseobacter sp.]
MSLLNIENLSVDINSTPVLRDVSLQLERGEILAITGESGSGKSMTALAAMQLLPTGSTQSGTVRLGQHNCSEMTEAALCTLRGRDIGMVFQEPMTALNPVQTIGAQVTETIRQHRRITMKDARALASATLARVGLPPDQFPPDRYPHQLSGGQRQRVVIAMAIVLKPSVLIADEPTTALDVTTQAQILDLITGLAREDRMGLVLITHDLAVVSGYADRIAVMQNGEIVESGAAKAILTNPHHPYTKILLEASGHTVKLPDPPPPEPLLDAQNITCKYRLPRRRLFEKPTFLEAVRDVSFTISRGERVGLVGESGCGKSTLTRALLGLEPLHTGSVTLAGAQVSCDKAPGRRARRHMQVVFQDPFGSFNPRHKVARLIAEPFHLLDNAPTKPEQARAIADALSAVGLEPTDGQRHIHEFSGGQRQRIAIARAIVIQPDLIIFDEAVSALDVSVRARILDLLAKLCDSHGLTYLFISHDLSVVRSITDRVLVMQEGRIVEEGPTEDVFTNPQHSYVKRLVAAVPPLVIPAVKSLNT